jgi:hypothetical protein
MNSRAAGSAFQAFVLDNVFRTRQRSCRCEDASDNIRSVSILYPQSRVKTAASAKGVGFKPVLAWTQIIDRPDERIL